MSVRPSEEHTNSAGKFRPTDRLDSKPRHKASPLSSLRRHALRRAPALCTPSRPSQRCGSAAIRADGREDSRKQGCCTARYSRPNNERRQPILSASWPSGVWSSACAGLGTAWAIQASGASAGASLAEEPRSRRRRRPRHAEDGGGPHRAGSASATRRAGRQRDGGATGRWRHGRDLCGQTGRGTRAREGAGGEAD